MPRHRLVFFFQCRKVVYAFCFLCMFFFVLVVKVMCFKRNKTLRDVRLLENNQLRGTNRNLLQHNTKPVVYYFPVTAPPASVL